MSKLKKENLDKCFSLLKEFIDDADSLNSKKGAAVMALDQLRRIAAGSGSLKGGSGGADLEAVCFTRPRAI